MKWIPTNKATGTKYPAISNEEKEAQERDVMTKGKFTYVQVADAAEPKPLQVAPPPAEAKKAPQ